MINILLVALGGAIGAALRYCITLIPIKTTTVFPYKTLIINVAGSFLIALFTVLALKYKALSPKIQLFLKTGICGGFTTFSTFSFETFTLFQSGHIWLGIIYAAASFLAGIGAVALLLVW